jgi:two-component system sensor histidine kinase HydH
MRKTRVLVVDDNAALIDNLREILEEAGYDVLSAGTREEALRAAAPGFEVALVDLRLPDGSGQEVGVELKSMQPEGEVVLLTGYATLETAIEAVRSGAFAYLVKPCSTPHLLLTIEQAMRQVRLHGEKRDLARRAAVAEKLAAVGTLTAGLSHEIKNPLNGAVLQLAVLERRVRRLPEGEQRALLEPLGLVRDEINRLGRLLDDFLRFARPRELSVKPVDAQALVESVHALLAADGERRGVALSCELQPVIVSGDAERLRQALVNLALNALDAAPRGGRVRLGLRAEGNEAVIEVEDSGPGVPHPVRERMFEPFFTTKPAGTGLGLPIVHAIVTQHGGTVGVTTSDLGGAKFWMRLQRGS